MLRSECKLRAIVADDLPKILTWRNSERIRANMYTDHVITPEEHRAWFDRVKGHKGSVFLLFEVQDRPVGLVYFTEIDTANDRSNWGFYLGEENVPRGCGTALGMLGLEYAFTQLKLRKLSGEAFAFNRASLRFHEKLGFREEGRFAEHVLKRGVYEDVFAFALFRQDWLSRRQALEEAAFEAGEVPA